MGDKIDCNRFVSPWDTSLAPPPSPDPGAVKVKELPKATITPADKSKPVEHRPSGKVLAWRSIAGTEGISRSGD